MKYLLLLFSLLGTVVAAQQVGDLATDFTLLNDQGAAVSLSDFAGTPVVLNFWASWCAPCVEEIPFFSEVSATVNANADTPELVFLLVNNSEDAGKALTFLRESLASPLPVALDADKATREALGLDRTLDVVKNYRVRGMPSTFFIDANGVIQAVKQGLLLESEAPALLATIGVEWSYE